MLPDTQRRRANIIAWCAIAVIAVLFIRESHGPARAAGSEKLRAQVEVSAQQAMMTSMVNGLRSPAFGAIAAQQLSAMGKQAADLVNEDEPGSELGSAPILVQAGLRDRALEQLAALRKRIDAGTVEASDDFMQTFDAVRTLVDAAGTPGARQIEPVVLERASNALGAGGRTLAAVATDDRAELDRLMSAGALVFGALVCMVLVGGALALCGVVGFIVFLVQAAQGRTAGVRATNDAFSHVYAEMFAVWLGSYLVLARVPRSLFGYLHERTGMAAPSMDVQTSIGVVGVFLAAAIAIWWGTRRGLSLRSLLAGVGLRRFHASDVVWGLVCWSIGLAFLILGLGITMVLTQIFSGGQLKASHPIQQMVEGSGAFGILLTYVLACVAAPIFEEFFFRGAMYRNLKQGTGAWGSLGGTAISMLVSSAIFAAIHPQGLLFAPVLGGLAVGFCVMREWRGTINASIVAHAMNNLTVLTLNVLMLRH